MSPQTPHRKWVALALGCVLAFGLAMPAFAAAAPAGPRGGWIEGVLLTWWEGLWTVKAEAYSATEAARPGGIETERSSGIDPNGRKSRGSATGGSVAKPETARPARQTFSYETIR